MLLVQLTPRFLDRLGVSVTKQKIGDVNMPHLGCVVPARLPPALKEFPVDWTLQKSLEGKNPRARLPLSESKPPRLAELSDWPPLVWRLRFRTFLRVRACRSSMQARLQELNVHPEKTLGSRKASDALTLR